MGTALLMAGSSLLGMLVPLIMNQQGFSTGTIGFVMAGYYIGLIFGSRYGQPLILRIGHIRAFAGFAAVVAAVCLLQPMLLTSTVWLLFRIMQGFCLAGLFSVIESWLNERSENATRGRLLSIYIMTQYISSALGQLVVNVWDIGDLHPFMIAGSLVALSLVPVVITRQAQPDLTQVQPLRMIDLYRASPLAVVGTFSSGIISGAMWGLGAVYAGSIGLDTLGTTIFYTSVVLGGFLLQMPIGRLSDKLDRRTVLAGVLVLTAGLCALGAILPSFGLGLIPVSIVGFLIGGPLVATYPLSTGQAYDYLPREKYVAAAGKLLLFYALGATAGPIVCAQIMGFLGPAAFYYFIGGFSIALFVYVLYRMRVRAPLPPREQEAFQVAPASVTPVTSEIYTAISEEQAASAAADATESGEPALDSEEKPPAS